MSLFTKELANIKNPAFGAALLYGLLLGYGRAKQDDKNMALPIAFIMLPFLMEPEVVNTIRQTRVGIRAVAEKLAANPKAGSDLLPRLRSLAISQRNYTVQCVSVLLRSRLAELDVSSGKLSLLDDLSLADISGVPREYSEAEKLGGWIANLSLFEMGSLFKVEL